MFDRATISTLILLILSCSAARAETAPSADQILKKVEQQVSADDESAKIEMTIIEANSSSKVREVQIRRKVNGSAQKVMVKLRSPADLRGTALLSFSDKDEEGEQWLYLPSSKQTRRILSGKKSSNFLDSELSYEDMGTSSNKKFANTILKTETSPTGPVTVIESKLISGDSTYSRLVTWVGMNGYLVSHIEYYDHDGKLLKFCDMKQYQKYAGKVWRAQEVYVKNVQNNRSTRLILKDLKLNAGLSDHDFTQTAMAED